MGCHTIPYGLVSHVATVMLTLLTIGVPGGLSLGGINIGHKIWIFIINAGVQARKAQVKQKAADGLLGVRIRDIVLRAMVENWFSV